MAVLGVFVHGLLDWISVKRLVLLDLQVETVTETVAYLTVQKNQGKLL